MIKNTTIIATPQNIELIKCFFEANNLTVNVGSYRVTLTDDEYEHSEHVRVEHYYMAISLDYEDEHTQVLLMNMAMTHNGLNNMLIDYLIRVRAEPIVMAPFSPRPPSIAKVQENFENNVKPKLREELKRKFPNVPASVIG